MSLKVRQEKYRDSFVSRYFLLYEVRFEFFDAVVSGAFKEVDFAADSRGFFRREGTCANRLVHAAPGVVTLNG